MAVKGLQEVLDVALLQQIQDILGETTGIAYNIVDMAGKPVNQFSNFSAFCQKMRSYPEGMKICSDANARSGFEAALQQRPFIFQCPAGLTDVAVPIIINNSYLGAVCFGQIRTDNSALQPMRGALDCSPVYEKHPELKKIFKTTTFVEYSKVMAIATLVDIIIHQLISKFDADALQKEIDYGKNRLEKAQKEQEQLHKELLRKELQIYQLQMDPQFIYNTLNIIARTALQEQAPKTQEAIFSIASFYRYASVQAGEKASVQDEIFQTEIYLRLQKIRFGDRVNWEIEMDENVKGIYIPEMVLMRFVEFAVIEGLCPKREGGTIWIKIHFWQSNLRIQIEDNGVGLSKERLFTLLHPVGEVKDHMTNTLYRANKILAAYYGEDHRADIRSEEGEGTKVEIRIPLLS